MLWCTSNPGPTNGTVVQATQSSNPWEDISPLHTESTSPTTLLHLPLKINKEWWLLWTARSSKNAWTRWPTSESSFSYFDKNIYPHHDIKNCPSGHLPTSCHGVHWRKWHFGAFWLWPWQYHLSFSSDLHQVLCAMVIRVMMQVQALSAVGSGLQGNRTGITKDELYKYRMWDVVRLAKIDCEEH